MVGIESIDDLGHRYRSRAQRIHLGDLLFGVIKALNQSILYFGGRGFEFDVIDLASFGI